MEYIECSSYNTFYPFQNITNAKSIGIYYRVLRCCVLMKKVKHSESREIGHRLLLLQLVTQPCNHLGSDGSLHPMRHMYYTPPLPIQHPTPFQVPCLVLQEQASRWCHHFACIILTIEVYAWLLDTIDFYKFHLSATYK